MTEAPQKAPSTSQSVVTIDCGNFLVRTTTVDDASDRWAGWMVDPKNLRLVNSSSKAMTRKDVAAYIRKFDQQSHLLLSIIEKQSGLQIGFFRVDVDRAWSRCLVFLMIGEHEFRHLGAVAEIGIPFHDYFFETLGIKTMMATVLATNRPMIRYLLKSGWHLDKTADRDIKSQTSDAMLALCYLSITRDAWRAWKSRNFHQESSS
jgi:RimJ/RimL family protein N-acetyltransferase